MLTTKSTCSCEELHLVNPILELKRCISSEYIIHIFYFLKHVLFCILLNCRLVKEHVVGSQGHRVSVFLSLLVCQVRPLENFITLLLMLCNM